MAMSTREAKLRNDEKLFGKLSHGYYDLINGYYPTNASCMQITVSNAGNPRSFSDACCVIDPVGQIVALGSFFHSGINLLKRYLKDPDYLPEDLPQRTALENLMIYLKEGEPPAELFSSSKYTRLEWTVLLAQHVLSKLAGQTYVIDMFSEDKHKLVHPLSGDLDEVCPCFEREKLSGVFDDTGFGCEEGWHGRVDILIGVPVQLKNRCEWADDSSSMCSDPCECTFALKDVEQLLSESIVYAFLQKKCDAKVSLVPTLGFSSKQLIISLYDCENDILILSADLDLEDPQNEGELNPTVIVLLWLALNYKLFCTGVPEALLQYKANFKKSVGDRLEYYEKNVQYGSCSSAKCDVELARFFAFRNKRGAVCL